MPSKPIKMQQLLLELEKSIPGMIPASTMKSKRTYVCANHPTKEAYCLCAKCGNLLCERCHMVTAGRCYCEQCLIEDDALRASFESEFFAPSVEQELEQKEDTWKAPQTLAEIPIAILNMMSDNYRFFKIAKESSFLATFMMAFIALLPHSVYIYLQLDTYIKLFPETIQSMLQGMLSLPAWVLFLAACGSTLMRIVMLDIAYFVCARFFTQSSITFPQASSVVHFCLLPLMFSVFAAIFEVPWLQYIFLGLMIMQLTTATRVSLKCTMGQGMGVMLCFILLTSMAGIL